MVNAGRGKAWRRDQFGQYGVKIVSALSVRPSVLKGRVMAPPTLWSRYKLRLRRKRLLWRGFRSRHKLTPVQNHTQQIAPADILLFATLRNEALRLPYFLQHYRALGVRHFLIVDNGSDDGTLDLLKAASDVSVWQTDASYKSARFGMDWLTWLLMRYGHGHWTVTVDADELLIYPQWETRDLTVLTTQLTSEGHRSLGTLMLDLYPKGSPDAQRYHAGEDPIPILPWFDGHGYWCERRGQHQSVSVLGGVRARMFFERTPEFAPVLSKVPLVKWHRSYAYFSSTHVALPQLLNAHHDLDGKERLTGVLLHTKFLPGTGARARIEKARGQQYTRGPAHDAYYDALAEAPDLWVPESIEFTGWRQLVDLGLMFRGPW